MIRRREPPRTLKRIRADACPEDRNTEALRLTPVPFTRPANTRYIETSYKPRNIDELRTQCEPYGAAAVQDALWRAISGWLMSSPYPAALMHGYSVASAAVALCRAAGQAHGYPDLTGLRKPPALPLMPVEAQHEARSIAACTIVEWQEAGCPRLASVIDDTYQYIVAYKREFTHGKTDIMKEQGNS